MQKQKSKIELELEQRIPIDDYFNKYLLPLNGKLRAISNSQPTSICPFHKENDPSFHFWASRKMVHCFGCGYSGNIVRVHETVQQMYHHRKLSKTEAINDLIRIYNLQSILAPQVEIEEPKSVFDKIREEMVTSMNQTSFPDQFDIVRFRKKNKEIQDMPVDTQVKLQEFANLDLLAGLYITKSAREKSSPANEG